MHFQQLVNKKSLTIFHLYSLTLTIQIDFIKFHIHFQIFQNQSYQKYLIYISF